jgi:hypothetical protein
VAVYLDRFVPLAVSVEGEGILSNPAGIDQGAADRLRAVYRQLHEMTVPPDAEEMHLAFIVYTSVLEEKVLCHTFAQAHAADAQAQYFREPSHARGDRCLEQPLPPVAGRLSATVLTDSPASWIPCLNSRTPKRPAWQRRRDPGESGSLRW